MNYISTVTSKGTITLPAAIRARLGIKEGDKVEISLRGNTIVTIPQLGWDEFFSDAYDMGKRARRQIKTGKKQALLTNDAIADTIRSARQARYAKS